MIIRQLSGWLHDLPQGRFLRLGKELRPVLAAMRDGLGMDMAKTKEIFVLLALFAHGYASIHANNDLDYNEELAAARLGVLEGEGIKSK